MAGVLRRRIAIAGLMLFAGAGLAAAQPSVDATTGQWSHEERVTIAGTGFGAKPDPAPVVWDDASGIDVATKWDGAWPDCPGNSRFNLAYRTPEDVGRGIPLPHRHATRYIAGAHAGPVPGPQCGYSVILWKSRTVTSLPAYSYVSWYQRTDDNWRFGGDDNYKTFAYSEGEGPYNLPNNWYAEYNPRPLGRASGAAWHLNDDGSSLQRPDRNGHSWWWDEAVNPMAGVWSKVEMEIKYTNLDDGYIKLWENGIQRIDYRGRTDNLSGSTRTEGIGGYARNYPYPSNWRYFADVYLDYSRARVLLGNAPTLAASTLREVQIPAVWSDTAVTVTVNAGAFADGDTAYLYVVDANGEANGAGHPVVIGGGDAAHAAAPPVPAPVPPEALAPTAPAPAAPRTIPGLVAAYDFDAGSGTTIADASGHHNTATIAGATWIAQGRYGGALAFDGTNDLVTVPDSASLDLSTALSIEAWVKPATTAGWRSVIMKETGGGLAYALYASDRAPRPSAQLRVAGGTRTGAIGGNAQIPADTWTHLAVTYDGSTLRLYVNGAETGAAALAGAVMPTSSPLRIGGNAVWGEYFAGSIDEVRIYDRALSAEEIRADLATPIR